MLLDLSLAVAFHTGTDRHTSAVSHAFLTKNPSLVGDFLE
jgi:hypothetical protein